MENDHGNGERYTTTPEELPGIWGITHKMKYTGNQETVPGRVINE